MDRAMAPILEALNESGAADNTIVVFTSDHEEMMGSHGMLHKEVLYQESIKVPLLMRVPWITNEYKQIAGHASQIDLVPTLLGLMGVPLPSHLEGRSLEPVLRGETFLEGDAVFVETNGPLIRAEAGDFGRWMEAQSEHRRAMRTLRLKRRSHRGEQPVRRPRPEGSHLEHDHFVAVVAARNRRRRAASGGVVRPQPSKQHRVRGYGK